MRSSTTAAPALRTPAAGRPFIIRAAARARPMKGAVSPKEL